MAVGVMLDMPGIAADEYEQINEAIFGSYPLDPKDAPDGLVMHSAGPSEDGWYVYDIWESKDDFRRFGEERVAPAVLQVTGRDFRDTGTRFFEVHNVTSVPASRERAR